LGLRFSAYATFPVQLKEFAKNPRSTWTTWTTPTFSRACAVQAFAVVQVHAWTTFTLSVSGSRYSRVNW